MRSPATGQLKTLISEGSVSRSPKTDPAANPEVNIRLRVEKQQARWQQGRAEEDREGS